MGLKPFNPDQLSDNPFTLPNGISLGRAVGGPILGAYLATNHIDPETALFAASLLAASDAEGLVIHATARYPWLQRALRIFPSRFGAKADAIADKVFGVTVFAGATIGGEMPWEEAVPIIVTEFATMGATAYATAKGGEPQVSRVGTWGMVARFGSVVTNLAARTVREGMPHEVMYVTGAASAVTAVALGALSCIGILGYVPQYEPRHAAPEAPAT